MKSAAKKTSLGSAGAGAEGETDEDLGRRGAAARTRAGADGDPILLHKGLEPLDALALLKAAHARGPVGEEAARVSEFVESYDPERWRKLVDAAVATEDERERAEALVAIAGHLSPSQLPEVFEAAKGIGDQEARRTALAGVAQHLELAVPWYRKLARILSSGRHVAQLIASLTFVLALSGGLAWLCWFHWMGDLRTWGFESPGEWWSMGLASLGMLYLAVIPLIPFSLLGSIVGFWEEYGTLRREVESARSAQGQIERALQENDPHQLVLILSYSRQMLSEYYAVAMSQAQRSFRYCLIAMWLGFAVLLLGVVSSFLPLDAWMLSRIGSGMTFPQASELLAASKSDHLVLLTGAVIEFIAAAFLWVYRSSIQQQTYYYRRQLRLHNVLLAHRLTAGMGARDDATMRVVERLLQEMDAPELEVRGGSGFASLLAKRE